ARAAQADAIEVDRIATRRREAGDVAALDTNVAASALARAKAEVHAAEAERVSALGMLRVLLDMRASESLSLDGDLRIRASAVPEPLLARALERPDVLLLKAELREAEAEVREGRSARWPEITPSFRYERDQGDRVLWGGLSLTLPFFDRGREARV